MSPAQLPGSRWFSWLRYPTLRLGVVVGLYLSVFFTAWLFIANRVPWSQRIAGIRNGAAGALLVALALIPVVRFLGSPLRLFAAGLSAWSVLTLAYLLLGLYFEQLYMRLGPFHLFVLGAASYGVIAVVCWVVSLVLAARHRPLAMPRRRSS